jgi:transcriptional regulator PpsR
VRTLCRVLGVSASGHCDWRERALRAKERQPASGLVQRRFQASDINPVWVADMNRNIPTWAGFSGLTGALPANRCATVESERTVTGYESMAVNPSTAPDFGAFSPLAKELAQAMARVASDIALVIDREGVIREVAEGSTPLPAECSRWVGQRWVDTASADTRRKIELLLGELNTTGVTQSREVNHPVDDGDAVPMAWTAIRLGAQGPVVAVGRDLRAVAAIQRRFLDAQHEMELDYWQRRHADSRYRTLFHVARDAVLVLDAATFDVIEANEAAHGLFEPGAAAAPGLLERMPATARAPLAELLATARSSGRAGEIRLRLAAPGPGWDVLATPFSVGERLHLLVRAREYDAGDHADTSSAIVRALVESTPDAVVITDSAGHVLIANPAFITLVQGGSEARLVGQGLADLVGDGDGAWRETIARTRLQGLRPRTPLVVRHGELGVAVEVASTVLAEGDQERLGFTLRTVEPPRAAASSQAQAAWPEFDALRAQVGLVPLATLLREGHDAFERRILRTALHVAAGRIDAAARLLAIEPQALGLRLHALALPSEEGDDADDDPSASPPRLN